MRRFFTRAPLVRTRGNEAVRLTHTYTLTSLHDPYPYKPYLLLHTTLKILQAYQTYLANTTTLFSYNPNHYHTI